MQDTRIYESSRLIKTTVLFHTLLLSRILYDLKTVTIGQPLTISLRIYFLLFLAQRS